MTDGIPPPPPNLKPPPKAKIKKRKNLTIKCDEFEAWQDLKGGRSWTAVMSFVRQEYLRLRDLKPIIMRSSGADPIERMRRDEEAKVQQQDPNRMELIGELKQLFSTVDNIKETLRKVTPEELEEIKVARQEHMRELSLF